MSKKQEYSNKCCELGDIDIRISLLDDDILKALAKVRELEAQLYALEYKKNQSITELKSMRLELCELKE
jgi:hypothetical protein